jgi:hypothetical protein
MGEGFNGTTRIEFNEKYKLYTQEIILYIHHLKQSTIMINNYNDKSYNDNNYILKSTITITTSSSNVEIP